MKKRKGCYIYFDSSWLDRLTRKANRKGLTLGVFCKEVIEREGLRDHRRKVK